MDEYTVYALMSEKDRRVYVGMTSNLDRRVREHNTGTVRSTKGYRPWKTFYSEIVSGRSDARIREKYLKSGIGKEFLKSLRDKNIPG